MPLHNINYGVEQKRPLSAGEKLWAALSGEENLGPAVAAAPSGFFGPTGTDPGYGPEEKSYGGADYVPEEAEQPTGPPTGPPTVPSQRPVGSSSLQEKEYARSLAQKEINKLIDPSGHYLKTLESMGISHGDSMPDMAAAIWDKFQEIESGEADPFQKTDLSIARRYLAFASQLSAGDEDEFYQPSIRGDIQKRGLAKLMMQAGSTFLLPQLQAARHGSVEEMEKYGPFMGPGEFKDKWRDIQERTKEETYREHLRPGQKSMPHGLLTFAEGHLPGLQKAFPKAFHREGWPVTLTQERRRQAQLDLIDRIMGGWNPEAGELGEPRGLRSPPGQGHRPWEWGQESEGMMDIFRGLQESSRPLEWEGNEGSMYPAYRGEYIGPRPPPPPSGPATGPSFLQREMQHYKPGWDLFHRNMDKTVGWLDDLVFPD